MLEGLVVEFSGVDAADCKHGVKAFMVWVVAVCFLFEVVEDMLGDFGDAIGVEEGEEGFCCVFGGIFVGFELRADVVVVYFEFEDFFIADGVGDEIGVEFAAEYAGGGIGGGGVFGEDGGSGESELVGFFEFCF